jgi:hypothetical protein
MHQQVEEAKAKQEVVGEEIKPCIAEQLMIEAVDSIYDLFD